MDIDTLLLFSATVVPLVCTPGPDIIFIAYQSPTRRRLIDGAAGGMILTAAGLIAVARR